MNISLTEWNQEVKAKIEDAIAISEQIPPIDGETFINEIIDRFVKSR
jgi:antitoxin ParD1/3/4